MGCKVCVCKKNVVTLQSNYKKNQEYEKDFLFIVFVYDAKRRG